MCGIAGAFAFSPDIKLVDQNTIVRLNEAQCRRGPDGTGLWSSDDSRVVFGHRRLAIIDTGSSGFQPMSDSTGRWVITFNGEIYNYRALRSELEHLGCAFRTNSDTEVLINAVALWGVAGLDRLRGMYAFALWDKLNQELWLVRDPFGIKPLYVAESRGTIWFASQARALANCAPIDTRRDAAGLTGFCLWGHIPEPFTWWVGIRMLPAGHVQRIRPGRPVEPPRPFHCIESAYTQRPPRPLSAGELHQLVRDSIQHHLVADVPVGIFLSAGIDSSVIASIAAELGAPLRTVTLAFSEYIGTADDEAPLAEATAKLLKSDHATVRTSVDEFEEIIDDFLKSMDQPTIDGLNTYLVSRATASQGLKVALSGLGGDELFGGYPSFRQIPRLVKWGRRIPGSKSLGRAVQRVFRSLPLPGIPPKCAGLLSHSGDIAHAYLLRRVLHLEDELDVLLDDGLLNEGLERLSTVGAVTATLSTLSTSGATPHAQIAALESCWYMRNQLLRDTDWSSMAHGLEVRLPFVDAHLLERLGPAIASGTPPTKQDLAACAKRLPPQLARRSKTGFSTPVKDWLAEATGTQSRGMRGWAIEVARRFDEEKIELGETSETARHHTSALEKSSQRDYSQVLCTSPPTDLGQAQTIKRVLIFRQGSIGDFVISLPCLHRIRNCYPSAETALLTNHPVSSVAAPSMSILQGTRLIDQYITYTGGTRHIRELMKIRRAVITFAPELLIYLAQPQGVLSSYRDYFFFRGCGIKSFLGLTLTRDLQNCRPPSADSTIWESEASRLGRSLGILSQIELERSENWDLHLSAAEIEKARCIVSEGIPLDQYGRGLLGLSIGTKQKINDWGDHNWLAALKGLKKLNLGLVLIGAAEERARSQKLAGEWHGPTLNLCGQISPRLSAAVIQHMALFLCHDSGPMHLAASVGTRCVAVFSRRNPPGTWFPFGRSHRILYPSLVTDTIESIRPNQVIAAATEILGMGAKHDNLGADAAIASVRFPQAVERENI